MVKLTTQPHNPAFNFDKVAAIVALLAEWLLPKPEIRGLNLIVGNFSFEIYCQQKIKNEEKTG